MKTHYLKTWPEPFAAIVDGRKTFEVRVNDRGFEVGDRLILQEYNPGSAEFTGAYVIVKVTYLLQGVFGLPPDVCVMGIWWLDRSPKGTEEER